MPYWRILVIAWLCIGTAACQGSEPTVVVAEASMNFLADAPGCGVVVKDANGEKRLITLKRGRLPQDWSIRGRRFSRGVDRHEMFRIVNIPSHDFGAGSTVVEGVCAVPFDAPAPTAIAIRDAVSQQLARGGYFERALNAVDIDAGDLAMRALIAEELEAAGLSLSAGTRRKSIANPSLRAIEGTGVPEASLGGVHTMATITVTASPWGNWFFDMRAIAGIWAALSHWSNQLDVEFVSFEGNIHPCAVLSETWHQLEAVRQDLLTMLQLLAGNGGVAQDFDATNVCPDSLMTPGQTCLDFYIATATATIMAGDNRGTDPYANIHQSKVFVLDDFDNNTVNIFVNGSTVLIPFSWRLSAPHVFTIGFPANPWAQIKSLEIEIPDENTREVTISIANAFCATWEYYLLGMFPGGVPESTRKAGCPTIDAKIRYARDGLGWHPVHVIRDAFPNLDIFRKMPDGSMALLNQSNARTRVGGWIFLLGINRLIYDIEQQQNELMGEMTSSNCGLQ